MRLPTNGERVIVVPFNMADLGSYSWYCEPSGSRAEKLPCRSASVGTVKMVGFGWLSFRPSYAKNQNILLRPLNFGSTTGPPAVTPHWLKCVTCSGWPVRLRKKSLATRSDG